jgi:hypothetical protein
MSLAVQLSDDQIAILGCAIVFGGCLVMMLVSQKIGDKVRGTSRRSSPNVVPFPTASVTSNNDRKAA